MSLSPNDQLSITDLVKQGATALKNGDRANAYRLLTQAVEQQPDHELAWLWLAGATPDPGARRACLERVLSLNPHNTMAQQGLAQLPQVDEPAPQTIPAPVTSAEPTPTPVQPARVDGQPLAAQLRPIQLGALEPVAPPRDDRAVKILTAMLALILVFVLLGILYLRMGGTAATNALLAPLTQAPRYAILIFYASKEII